MESSGIKTVGAHVIFHKLLATSEEGKGVMAVLLCKRTQDAPIFPGYWSAFGGASDGGESPQAALTRELHEEMDLPAEGWAEVDQVVSLPGAFLCEVVVTRGSERVGVQFYQCPLPLDIDQIRLKRTRFSGVLEGEGLAYFTEEECQHLLIGPDVRKALGVFFNTVTYIKRDCSFEGISRPRSMWLHL